MEMGKRIKEQRILMGLTQEELANKLGLQKSAIAKYENGRVENIKRSVIRNMADILNCKPSYLMGLEDYEDTGRKIPVFGRVAAGIPIEAIENIIDYEEIPNSWQGEYGALVVAGDSMSPRISDGDVVIVKRQKTAETGDIVVAIINGEDATVKRLIRRNEGIVLQPLNPSYEPMYFSPNEIEQTPVTIWGKVVENRAKF